MFSIDRLSLTPKPKSQAVDGILSVLNGGKNRHTIIRERKCMTCDGTAKTFRDDLSVKEYTISGMCQQCQDETFDTDDESMVMTELEER
jgi:hypothetical protein